jgi:hypothetical protein
MKVQSWIVSVRYWTPRQGKAPAVNRWAVVGPARASTVEAVLQNVPEEIRSEIRAHAGVRDFVEGKCKTDLTGYYVESAPRTNYDVSSWLVCIGPVHEVLA